MIKKTILFIVAVNALALEPLANPDNSVSPHLPAPREVYASCRLYPLEVNFQELEFERIVSPVKLDIGYCAGECDYLHVLENNHSSSAVLRAQMLQDSSAPKVKGPCCTPNEYVSNVEVVKLHPTVRLNVTRIYDKFVIKSCGCY